MEKHSAGEGLQSTILSAPTSRGVHPIIFEEITALSIIEAALHTDGSTGPSGLDASAWKRICSSFQKASNDLFSAIYSHYYKKDCKYCGRSWASTSADCLSTCCSGKVSRGTTDRGGVSGTENYQQIHPVCYLIGNSGGDRTISVVCGPEKWLRNCCACT